MSSPSLTMRAELIGHFKPCMTEIYQHIDARMADYIHTHPYVLHFSPPSPSLSLEYHCPGFNSEIWAVVVTCRRVTSLSLLSVSLWRCYRLQVEVERNGMNALNLYVNVEHGKSSRAVSPGRYVADFLAPLPTATASLSLPAEFARLPHDLYGLDRWIFN